MTMVTALALAVAMAAASGPQASAGGSRAMAATAQTAAIDRILVMPFENPSHEGRLYWLREASAVLLAEDLRACGATAIGRDERMKAFERLGVPAGATLSDATVIKVAQLLGASSVVIGSLAAEGDNLTIRARTIRLDSGRLQTEIDERAPLPDLFRMFDRIVIRLFPVLLAPASHTDKDHAPLPAFENYIKGLIAESGPGQVKFLQAALKDYPGYDAARTALWQVYNGQGDHGKALAVALEVPERSAAFRRARFLAALSQMQLNQYEQAYTTLRALSGQQPGATILNNLGVVQLRRAAAGQGGSASYYFNEARKLDEDDFDYTFNLGYAFMLERDLQAAIYWLREAVRDNPADGDAHYVLGAALTGTGAATEGAREKDLARRLSSRYAEWDKRSASDPVPHGLERVKEDLEPGALARGDLAFQTAGQKDQQDLAKFHLEQGRRSFEQENDRDGIAELKRAIYLSPYDAEAHLLLGRIYLRNSRLREAIDELKISLWSQETVAAHLALGEAYLQAKDPASARGEAQRALTLDPQSADAKKLLDRIGQ
jgi:Flp pilus assembly protein TadD/TolB-like protein